MREPCSFTNALRDMAQHARQAARRRAALHADGCGTYRLIWNHGREAILCLCCGIWSYNGGDIREKFCGFCDAYHAEWQEDNTHA